MARTQINVNVRSESRSNSSVVIVNCDDVLWGTILSELLARGHKKIVLDFRDVTLDCSGMEQLIKYRDEARRLAAQIQIVNLVCAVPDPGPLVRAFFSTLACLIAS